MTAVSIRTRCLVTFIILLAGVASVARAQETVMPLIQMDGVPLKDAIKNFARQSGFNFIFDPHFPGSGPNTASSAPAVTRSWTNVTAQAALKDLLAQYKITMVYSPATTVARIAPDDLGLKPVPAGQVGTNDSKAIPLISMESVWLNDAIANLARQAGLKISFDPEVSSPVYDGRQPVSFRWQKITARQALAALLDNYGLVLIEDPATSTARIALQAKN